MIRICLAPVNCAVNEQKFVEAPAGLAVSSDQNVRPLRVVHLRADLAAGTDVQYQWNLGDGVVRFAGNQVSNVYPVAGELHRDCHGHQRFLCAYRPETSLVTISDSASPVPLGPAPRRAAAASRATKSSSNSSPATSTAKAAI